VGLAAGIRGGTGRRPGAEDPEMALGGGAVEGRLVARPSLAASKTIVIAWVVVGRDFLETLTGQVTRPIRVDDG
jgi:hypothetical protein